MPEVADRFRGFTPVITHRLVESFGPTVEAGTEVELVYDESMTQRLREAYPETVDLALRSDLVTIHVVQHPPEGGWRWSTARCS
jgi:predicted transcriptional regulator